MFASFGDSHSLIDITVSLKRKALRLSPAWATVAGAFAVGVKADSRSLLQLLVLILLTDPLWGSLWALLVGWPGNANGERRPFWSRWSLPYRASGSPAERVAHAARGLQIPEAYASGILESLAIAFAFALVISLAVGKWAVAATLAVLALSAAAAIRRRSRPWLATISGLVFFIAPFCLAACTLGRPTKIVAALAILWLPVYVASTNFGYGGWKRFLLTVPAVLTGVYLLWLHSVFGGVLVLLSALPLVAMEGMDERAHLYLLLELLATSVVVGYGL